MAEDGAPWQKFYDNIYVPTHIDYPDISMYEFVKRAATRFPMMTAMEYMGKTYTYKRLMEKIDHVSSCLYRLGIRQGDRVLICLPNIPQAIFLIYGLNKIGAVAVVIHPLSAKNELKYFLNECNCHLAITFEMCVPKFTAIKDETPMTMLIVASVKDEMNTVVKIGYDIKVGRKDPIVPKLPYIIRWRDFINYTERDLVPKLNLTSKEPAMILYSGGTTGSPKGVVLSNLNLNATSMATIGISECIPCDFTDFYTDAFKEYLDSHYKVLSVMPIFHGFGFAVGIHAFLTLGGTCIMVPRFTPDSFAKLIVKHKPEFIAGVPTLFEHMIRSKHMKNVDLSFFKGVFVGGDALPIDTRKKLDAFFEEHNSHVFVREGYGMTECVTVTCLTPNGFEKPGIIGIPVPDVYYKIVKEKTDIEVPYGQEGEICLRGPCVMMGYINNQEETDNVIRLHSDGYKWLHTGDIGTMNEDGMISFRMRYKRMIVTSGYNVYPIVVENIINTHPAVDCCCVIGVPDPIKVRKVKAIVCLKRQTMDEKKLLAELVQLCKDSVSRYAVPSEFEFVTDMPRTKLNKIDFKLLEEQEEEKYQKLLEAGEFDDIDHEKEKVIDIPKIIKQKEEQFEKKKEERTAKRKAKKETAAKAKEAKKKENAQPEKKQEKKPVSEKKTVKEEPKKPKTKKKRLSLFGSKKSTKKAPAKKKTEVKPETKKSPKKATADKTATKKPAVKKKATAKKTTSKKAVAKKSAVKKPAQKKAVVKKPVSKKKTKKA